jgi:DNA-binding MarR family transcriptional regulator
MTARATGWAWDQRGLSPTEKLVLLALSENSSDSAPGPQTNQIADTCELPLDKLNDVLASLLSAGLVDTEYRTVVR